MFETDDEKRKGGDMIWDYLFIYLFIFIIFWKHLDVLYAAMSPYRNVSIPQCRNAAGGLDC